MKNLKERQLNAFSDNASVNAGGGQSIQKFSNKQFGSTFSRVVRQLHVNAVVETDPSTSLTKVKVDIPRIDNTIIHGRATEYSNSGTSQWKSLQEDELLPDPFNVGKRPYVTFSYQNNYLVFINPQDAYAAGVRIVIQLLFVEL